MSKVRVNCFSVSLDGYGAGPHQDRDNPLGVRGTELHDWFFPTRTFQSMYGRKGGSTGIDDDFARRGTENVGAWIMGRNMFGPIRGAWSDEGWRGWWGDDPPYHVPVFVLTHHPRESLEMQGGTTFHFVTEGIDEALRQAKRAAGSRDVRLGGGVDTVRQYLRAGLVDVLHLAMTPVLLGYGELLFAGVSMSELGYRVTEHVTSEAAMHVVIEHGPRAAPAEAVAPRCREAQFSVETSRQSRAQRRRTRKPSAARLEASRQLTAQSSSTLAPPDRDRRTARPVERRAAPTAWARAGHPKPPANGR